MVGSKGWDAASVRICGGLVLEEEEEVKGAVSYYSDSGSRRGAGDGGGEVESEKKKNNSVCQGKKAYEKKRGQRRRRILILNTHLDDQGRISRVESAKLILHFARQIRHDWAVDGVVLAGDLNSEATSSTTTTTNNKTLTTNTHTDSPPPSSQDREDESRAKPVKQDQDQEDAWSILNAPDSGMRDLRSLVPQKERYGHEMTFTGFNGHGDEEGRCTRIDFVHVGISNGTGRGEDNRDGDARTFKAKEISPSGEEEDKEEERSPWLLQVEGYAVLPNVFDDGIYISDHRAVVGDLVLKGEGEREMDSS